MTAFVQIHTIFPFCVVTTLRSTKTTRLGLAKDHVLAFNSCYVATNTAGDVQTSPWKYPVVFTLANVWTQSWTAVTGLAAYSPSCSSATILCAFHCKSYAVCDITCHVKMPIWQHKPMWNLNAPTLYYCWLSWFQTLLPLVAGDFRPLPTSSLK